MSGTLRPAARHDAVILERARDVDCVSRWLVVRGPDGRGTPTLKCSTCHQTVNTAAGRVPGAPHWQLAPRSMVWEGSDADLCRALKDPAKNRAARSRPWWIT